MVDIKLSNQNPKIISSKRDEVSGYDREWKNEGSPDHFRLYL